MEATAAQERSSMPATARVVGVALLVTTMEASPELGGITAAAVPEQAEAIASRVVMALKE